MVKHIVMWKLKDAAEGANKKENALKMKASLEELKSKIKEIKFLEVGISVSDAADFYDIVLTTEFKDAKDMIIYQKNADHQKVAGFIGKIQAERKVVDYIA
jgi:hypothetical protein